jgi:hypothetical protein
MTVLQELLDVVIFLVCLCHHNGRRRVNNRRTVWKERGAVMELLEVRDVHYRMCLVSLRKIQTIGYRGDDLSNLVRTMVPGL